jgi:hypothetical protein
MFSRQRLVDLTSSNGQFRFTHQADGNVVLYRIVDGTVVLHPEMWQSHTQLGTANPTVGAAVMLDGRFLLSNAASEIVVQYPPVGVPTEGGAYLLVQGDGNVVIVGASGSPAYWATNTNVPALATGHSMSGTQRLEYLTSANGAYRLSHRNSDGKLVLIRVSDGNELWVGEFGGDGPAILSNGRLSIFDRYMLPRNEVWHRGVGGDASARLELGDDGDIVIYGGDGHVIWDAQTGEYPVRMTGEILYAGEQLGRITSPNGRFTFERTTGGFLNLIDHVRGELDWENDDAPFGGTGPAVLLPEGDFVVYNNTTSGRDIIWETGTGGANPRLAIHDDGNVILYFDGQPPTVITGAIDYPVDSGYELQSGHRFTSLSSSSGRFNLVLQGSDGNVVLYDNQPVRHSLWASGTNTGGYNGPLVLQAGRLSLLTRYQLPRFELWGVGSAVDGGAVLDVQNDGNVVIYHADHHTKIWDTATVRPGCTDQAASNYDAYATWDNGTCQYIQPPKYGCTDPNALNYDPTATVDDGTCHYQPPPPPVYGCTNHNAVNFDPDATVDDGSCIVPPPCDRGDILCRGHEYGRGFQLVSQNQQYEFDFQGSDGNLVIYGPGGVVWTANTQDEDATVLSMQGSDGNFVIYNGSGQPIRAAGTNPDGAYLILEDDGMLVVRDKWGNRLWDWTYSFEP